MQCPIDGDECEGACGPKNTMMCHKRCQAGKDWMDNLLSRDIKARKWKEEGGFKVKGPEQHGVHWWARKYNCTCQPCRDITAKKRREQRTKAKERSTAGATRTDTVGFTHGTRYAFNTVRCQCPICLDARVAWLESEKQRKKDAREKRKGQGQGRGRGSGADHRPNRTAEAEGNRQSGVVAA